MVSTSGLLAQQDLWHSSFGKTLQICCSGCRGHNDEDLMPRWATRRPGQYIASRKNCPSAQCKGTKKYVVPVDTNILWVENNKNKIKASPRTGEAEWYGSILQPTDRKNKELPANVELWCFRCKEQTEVSGNRF